jgi:glycosyltransferase involved in cell wall biosynthesis
MKVAFITPPCQPTDGGVYSFAHTALEGLKAVETQHEFEYVELGGKIDADFAWFLTPHWQQVNCPFAITVWDLGHRVLPEFPEVSLSGWTFDQRESFYSHVLTRATLVVTGNEAGRRQIRRYYSVDEQRIVINPLPLSSALAKAKSSGVSETYKPYLLYPAQFWPHKNHVMILDAMKRLPDFKVIFTGADKGNQGYVEQYAQKLGLTQQVIFKGFVPIEELKGLYENAHAMVFASLLGPDNLPPVEALSLGCPVLCYDYDGAREDLSPYVDHFIDAEEIAEFVINEEIAEFVINPMKHNLSTYQPPTANSYASRIVEELDDFSSTRKLWDRNYVHL